jgi:hypothetical protein
VISHFASDVQFDLGILKRPAVIMLSSLLLLVTIVCVLIDNTTTSVSFEQITIDLEEECEVVDDFEWPDSVGPVTLKGYREMRLHSNMTMIPGVVWVFCTSVLILP